MITRDYPDLTNFFPDAPKERIILAVGVGSAGCRIVSQVKRNNTSINRFAAVSLDEDDLKGLPESETRLIPPMPLGKMSSSYVRAAALDRMSEIRALIGKPTLTFIIGGLGGGMGSALAPMVAEAAGEEGGMTVGVAVMPCKFEKNKHFHAGVALRKLHSCTDAVIVIDNEGFFEHEPQMPILDTYALINEKISFALEKITGASNEKEFPIGLNKLAYTINQEGFSILSMCSSTSLSEAEEAVAGAVQTICRITEPNKASRAILHLVGNINLTTSDIATSVRRVNDLLGGSLEIYHGFSAGGNTQQLTAILVASGFKSTKFDDYDPISACLDEQWQIDESSECALGIEMPKLTSIE